MWSTPAYAWIWPGCRGEGNAVAAGGTKYDIYADNLIAEFGVGGGLHH